MLTSIMTPALKWAGGKTQILSEISKRIPSEFNNYYEPFIGGASVLLYLSPNHAYINDINEQLINFYTQIRDSADVLIEKISEFDRMDCDQNFYYGMRKKYNEKIHNKELDAECAAMMIWINKHCYNGLYRVNSNGLFNVPYNNKTSGKSIDELNIRAISDFFNNSKISISCGDFEKACEGVQNGDFVYFDSPYVPSSETANFTDYSAGGFGVDDHKRLSNLYRKLDKIGAKLMLSNNDVPFVRSMYGEFNIQSIDVKRLINRNSSGRTGKEVLITNY